MDETFALSDREVLQIVRSELDSAILWSWTELSNLRADAMSTYLGEPRGDEIEGRSNVHTRDVFELVEWLMPTLMEIFASAGTEVASFEARSPEDEEVARQATDLVNYIFSEQSNGFMVLYTMFKDALISKNGIAKVYWRRNRIGSYESYQGKTLVEMTQLLMDVTFSARSTRIYYDGNEITQTELESIPEGTLDPSLVTVDVEGLRTSGGDGFVCVENVAPEDFVINKSARALDHPSCRFASHQIQTTRSDLIRQGFDRDSVERIPRSSTNRVLSRSNEHLARIAKEGGSILETTTRTDSEMPVVYNESYTLIDRDDDGVSEWWQVCSGGERAEVFLSAVPVAGHPFAAVTAIPIPHRFYGLSVPDSASDLEDVNTTLIRQLLNSLYRATDPRTVVLASGRGDAAVPMADLGQLVNSRPNSYVLEYAPGAIRPFPQPDKPLEILPALERISKMKAERLGVSADAMGINPDSISKHVVGTLVQQSAAAQRIVLYARIFAATGVRDIFRLIYRTLLTYQSRPLSIRLRNRWVEVDPSSWRGDLDCVISVGLGHGTRFEKSANLQTIGEYQKILLESEGLNYLVTPEQVYATISDLTQALGFPNPGRYFSDPAQVQAPEPQADPIQEAVELERQMAAMKIEIDRQKVDMEFLRISLDRKKAELEHEREMLKIGKQPADAPFKLVS